MSFTHSYCEENDEINQQSFGLMCFDSRITFSFIQTFHSIITLNNKPGKQQSDDNALFIVIETVEKQSKTNNLFLFQEEMKQHQPV